VKRALLILAFLLLTPSLWAAEKVYGAGVKLDETVKISTLLEQPDLYLGKTVRVEGKITEVCAMKGCWMELAEGPQARLRVKVEDDVIAFPISARGKIGVAEGVLEAIPMTRESYLEWQRHLAEERGQTFDASTVGDGPYRVLQVQATGAKILDP
jgi:uncharacterized protein DUF4920